MKTNGCSGGLSKLWWLIKQDPCPFEPACDIHDLFYINNKLTGGGSGIDKKKVDCDLLVNIVKCGYPMWGIVIYLAIRLWTKLAWWVCVVFPFLKSLFRFWQYDKQPSKLHFKNKAYTNEYRKELEKQFTKHKNDLEFKKTKE